MADSTKLSLIMGARNGALESREENDYYATDPRALELFIDKFIDDGERFSDDVWECACGEGHLSNVLHRYGYRVWSTDLVDRGYEGAEIRDFLAERHLWGGDIITNPPYKHAKEFVLQALDNIRKGNKVIFFLKCQFLEGQDRFKSIFKDYHQNMYMSTQHAKIVLRMGSLISTLQLHYATAGLCGKKDSRVKQF